MHSAPSVSYPAGRSHLAAALLLLAWLAGVAATAAWWFRSQPHLWWQAGPWLVVAAAGAFAAWKWWHGARGILAWDADGWSWSGQGGQQAGTLEVSLDLQHWLLLRWSDPNGLQWLWLERAGRAESWDDLRRAVYSRARIEALPESRPSQRPHDKEA